MAEATCLAHCLTVRCILGHPSPFLYFMWCQNEEGAEGTRSEVTWVCLLPRSCEAGEVGQ